MGERLGRPWGGVKALRRVWDGESDHRLSPLSTKPSQGLIDVQDEMMGGESVMSLVPCESTVRVFLLPVSLPVRSRFYSRFQVQLNRTPSHSFRQISSSFQCEHRSWSHSISLDPYPH